MKHHSLPEKIIAKINEIESEFCDCDIMYGKLCTIHQQMAELGSIIFDFYY